MKRLHTNVNRILHHQIYRLAAVILTKLALNQTENTIRRNFVVLAITLTMAACSVGCGSIPNAFEKMYPTFQETQSAWPALPADAGRVVVYWPAVQGQGFLQAPASEVLTIDGDKSKITSIASGMFVFADLSPGIHTFEIKPRGWFAHKEALPVTFSAGEFVYLKTYMPDQDSTNRPAFSISAGSYQFMIVPASEALPALQSLRHEYKKALPFTEHPGLPAM